MVSVYQLKPRFQALLRPCTNWLASRGVTANQVTGTALVLSVVLGAGFSIRPALFVALPVFLFFRMALNAIDGMLAREHGQKSRPGFLFNELSDVLADAALYLPFALVPGVQGMLVVIAVLMAVVTEFTGVCALGIGASRRYDGPFGKSDRAVAAGALGLYLGCGFPAGPVINIGFGLSIVLLTLTTLNRARAALAEGQA